MCGIFGGLIDKLEELYYLNSNRGTKGVGCLLISDASTSIIRSKYYPFRQIIKPYKTGYVHTVSPTSEHFRIHPFEVDNLVFAHNGLILNYKGFDRWSYLGPIDSQYILAGVYQKYTIYESLPIAIKHVCEYLQGQMACWLYNKEDSKLYLWRVMSPLFVLTNPFSFSSVHKKGMTELKEGKIYCYSNDNLEVVEQFKYYSPYLV